MADVATTAPETLPPDAVAPAEPEDGRPEERQPQGPRRPTRSRLPARSRRRALAVAGEAAVSTGVALGFTLWARTVDVDPLIRIGQVSGLATLQFRAALIALPVLAAVLYAAHRASRRHFQHALRLGCAVVAGLGTGIVAGGITVALHGTPWGLGGQDGDPGVLQGYATSFLRGEGLPGIYPPGFIVLLAEWTQHLRHGQVGYALKDLQLLLSALLGPACYLAWRTLLRPGWALAVALPAAVVFLDPIRPYSHLVMVVLLPVLARLLTELTRAPGRPPRSAALRGALLGGALGLLFLTYCGWFVWTGPGALVAVAALFPWRGGRAAVLRAGALLAAAAAAFCAVGSPLLLRMLQNASGTVDRYAYFDVYTDPAYVLGWHQDRPGRLTELPWQPTGELAGQGTFTLLLLAGAAVALALGLRRPAVIAALSCLVSAWLLRFWFAGHMERDQAVMLYPRTTWQILYALIALTVLAAMLATRTARALTARTFPTPSPTLGRRLAAGSLCAAALFAAMGASWSANRYQPSDPTHQNMGLDAWRAHHLQRTDGTCSPYAAGPCVAPHFLGRPTDSTYPLLWCGNIPTEQWTAYCGAPAPWAKAK
ncbi:hypothetical protein GCM10018790_70190 [Kitasatospora xanthocidica]|nr:hypothetical protein GCM10018790_70190 [Kitasatospora xanthocidica]